MTVSIRSEATRLLWTTCLALGFLWLGVFLIGAEMEDPLFAGAEIPELVVITFYPSVILLVGLILCGIVVTGHMEDSEQDRARRWPRALTQFAHWLLILAAVGYVLLWGATTGLFA